MGEHIPEWCMTSINETNNNHYNHYNYYNRPIEIAHRGYSSKYVDNSKEAFNEAIIHKFDMIELDIQLCKNEIIVSHDLTIENKNMIDMTIEELKKYNIITLREFFNIVNRKNTLVYLDLKGSIELSQKLLDYLYELNIDLTKVFIASFNIEHLDTIYKMNKTIKLGYITNNMLDNKVINDLMKYDLRFICFYYSILTQECIDYCHNKNTKVFVYTCSNSKDYDVIKKLNNLDGIVTDYKIFD
ncbi:MAG: hypothetical protein CXT73_06375 [Methanobacteriota archaeon]|jgi:glycerophosphoryl diester phosphodiesterase|nr:MAG: hypothetical protein CXT73_06375 [Euryarchaeota archaeon]